MEEMKQIKPYIRKANYYETDQMAIIHHSNYIRWFEEARVNFLEQIGLGYDTIEAAGVYSPVLRVNCEYRSSVRFNETVEIRVILRAFNGIMMTIEYQIVDSISKKMKANGSSDHCFVATNFRPVSLKKNYKKMYDILSQWVGVEGTV